MGKRPEICRLTTLSLIQFGTYILHGNNTLNLAETEYSMYSLGFSNRFAFLPKSPKVGLTHTSGFFPKPSLYIRGRGSIHSWTLVVLFQVYTLADAGVNPRSLLVD